MQDGDQRLVELLARHQRLFAFRAQRMGENRGGEQLHLIGRGAAVGVLERDDLALFGDLESVGEPVGMLAQDRAMRGASAATDRTTSTVEAQAGGDIAAWQFNPGVGGTTDTYLRKGLFAVLPSYGYDFAPYDSDIRSRTQQIGTDLKVGDQVTITTGNNALAAGTYTLLDARYGILPGAVLVSATTLNVSRPMPVAVKNDDGSVIVSGYRTSTGTAQNGGNDQRQALLIEPEATYRAKSAITVVSGNAFQRERDGVQRARRLTAPRQRGINGGTLQRSRQRGFVEYLTKPLDVGKLLSLLDRCAQGEVLTSAGR